MKMKRSVMALLVAVVTLITSTAFADDDVAVGTGSGEGAGVGQCTYEIGFTAEKSNRYSYYYYPSTQIRVVLEQMPQSNCSEEYPDTEFVSCEDFSWTPENGGGDYAGGWIVCGYYSGPYLKLGKVAPANAADIFVNEAVPIEYCRYLAWDVTIGANACAAPTEGAMVQITGTLSVAAKRYPSPPGLGPGY